MKPAATKDRFIIGNLRRALFPAGGAGHLAASNLKLFP
jgi:hypothetical protein